MATSPKAFLVELYREYLEEASFLYEQRSNLLTDSEVTWKGIGEFEERFEAHIDGLVVGGELALEVCTKQAREGDFGELHAAVRVFCRQNRQDLVLQALKELDAEDPQKTEAVSNALKHEFPERWLPEFLKILSGGEEKLTPILANLFGYRRFESARNWGKVLMERPANASPTSIRAIGRFGDQGARESLLKLLQHEDETVCAAAALALMRLGEERAVGYCLQRARSKSWSCLPLGLGGGRSALMEMLERSKATQVNSDVLIALGLLGVVSGIPVILRGLANPDLADTSAIALEAITGANLNETVFVPEKIDPSELSEEEREKFKDGKPAMRPDGKPYGTNVTRISLNPKDWEKWWNENTRRFNPDSRYRYGKPYSPATLLDTLASESSPHLLRRLAYEELVIRYGCNFTFETDMLVKEQESALAKCGEWVAANNARFTPGEWYFAGRLAS